MPITSASAPPSKSARQSRSSPTNRSPTNPKPAQSASHAEKLGAFFAHPPANWQLQIIEEELRHAMHQHPACCWVAHAMATAGKWQHLHVLSRIDQRVQQRKRIRKMYIVVVR